MAMVQPRRSVAPQFRGGFPNWFHHHGIKCALKFFDRGQRCITISGSVASLTILPAGVGHPNEWLVEWCIMQSCGGASTGERFFSSQELASAFGLSTETSDTGQWLIDRFGGHSACQGKYIMWRLNNESFCLNIPGPGTGHDGDPNISIDVDPTMRTAVRELLGLV